MHSKMGCSRQDHFLLVFWGPGASEKVQKGKWLGQRENLGQNSERLRSNTQKLQHSDSTSFDNQVILGGSRCNSGSYCKRSLSVRDMSIGVNRFRHCKLLTIIYSSEGVQSLFSSV